jgi:hypothetical protein
VGKSEQSSTTVEAAPNRITFKGTYPNLSPALQSSFQTIRRYYREITDFSYDILQKPMKENNYTMGSDTQPSRETPDEAKEHEKKLVSALKYLDQLINPKTNPLIIFEQDTVDKISQACRIIVENISEEQRCALVNKTDKAQQALTRGIRAKQEDFLTPFQNANQETIKMLREFLGQTKEEC